MQKISISPIDICVTNYKSRRSREKVDPCIIQIISWTLQGVFSKAGAANIDGTFSVSSIYFTSHLVSHQSLLVKLCIDGESGTNTQIIPFCMSKSSVMVDTRGSPKIDHSGSCARIVLEQNKFSKKVTSYRD